MAPSPTNKSALPMQQNNPLEPGATIGILGGGQLGRMLALAAYRLGFRVHAFCQHASEPLAQVTPQRTLAAFDDAAAQQDFAEQVDCITLEFENLPLASLEQLARAKPLRPAPAVLAVAQDRAQEKALVAQLDSAASLAYRLVQDEAGLEAAMQELGLPLVVKTRQGGYDGKGQWRIRDRAEAVALWDSLGQSRQQAPVQHPLLAEPLIDFAYETSALVARSVSGETAVFPCAENQHEAGILRRSLVPGRLSCSIEAQAQALAVKLAERLDLCGTLAVEYFVTPQGQLLFNEMAPRPHNSGHWTLDGCSVDQFEQHIRAIAGWPLRRPRLLAPTQMENLLGDAVLDPALRAQGNLQIYGKADCREGRKMGHLNRLVRE